MHRRHHLSSAVWDQRPSRQEVGLAQLLPVLLHTYLLLCQPLHVLVVYRLRVGVLVLLDGVPLDGPTQIAFEAAAALAVGGACQCPAPVAPAESEPLAMWTGAGAGCNPGECLPVPLLQRQSQ